MIFAMWLYPQVICLYKKHLSRLIGFLLLAIDERVVHLLAIAVP